MPVPEDLDGAERFSVTGRNGWKIAEAVRFGPFELVDIRRSWTRGKDFEIVGYETTDREQRYSFVTVENGDEGFGVSCEARLGLRLITTEIVDFEMRNRSKLFCSLFPSGEASRDWVLSLEEKGDKPLAGSLTVGSRVYHVTGTKRIAGGLPSESTSGYLIRRNGATLAAVGTLNEGFVALSRGLEPDERLLAAATAGALFLLEDLRAHASYD